MRVKGVRKEWKGRYINANTVYRVVRGEDSGGAFQIKRTPCSEGWTCLRVGDYCLPEGGYWVVVSYEENLKKILG